MMNEWCILFVSMSCVFCKTSIITYPTVDLLENSPLNTFVIRLNISHKAQSSKLVLLNMNGYETSVFSLINASLYTIDVIDRERFVSDQSCSDELYCKIEVHILVDDGLEYCVVPIHVVDENDNSPEFERDSIKLKFRDNVMNGYQIPFEGAKDLDEGRNGVIRYLLDCSNKFNQRNHSLSSPPSSSSSSSMGCLPLFELLILSQSSSSSSSFHSDRLALKFIPSSLVTIENEYELQLYATDQSIENSQFPSVLKITVQIERKEKKRIEFSLSEYEFVVLIDRSINRNEIVVGRVYANGEKDRFDRIKYQLTTNHQDVRINSLTGQLIYLWNENLTNINNEIHLHVQASSFSLFQETTIQKGSTSSVKVRLLIRYVDEVKNISFDYHLISSNCRRRRRRISFEMNETNVFEIDENVNMNSQLFDLSISSFSYPNDTYILSIENSLTIFSFSLSSKNNYVLKTLDHLTSESNYSISIGIKHQLSQQWLPNLTIELLVIGQWTTTTRTTDVVLISDPMTTTTMRTRTTSLSSEIDEFCVRNKSYILKERENEELGLLRVIESSSRMMMKTNESFFCCESLEMINENEMNIDGCRMWFDRLNDQFFNQSSNYQLCLSSFVFDNNECYNLTMINQILLPLINGTNNRRVLVFFSLKPIEIGMLILSMIFVLITIVLLFLFCRLKEIEICFQMKTYFFDHHKSDQKHHQQSSTSPKRTTRVHSIVVEECRSSSLFESINTKNDPNIFDIADLLVREPLPSTHLYVLPSIVQQLSSCSLSLSCSMEREVESTNNRMATTPQPLTSSSFLQETKQLLDIIASNPVLEKESKLEM